MSVSFDPCNNKFCPDGNCIGCKNGQVWCQDPRCQPYCSMCAIQTTTDFNGNIVFLVILSCLITTLFIVWFVYGPQLFEHHNDHDRAGVIMPVSPQYPK